MSGGRSGEAAIGRPVQELETPAVVVDLDALERNVARAGAYAREHGLALWPHLKTHKTAAVAARQRAAGAAGFTAAKSSEALRFAGQDLGPLLLHYPVFGAAKWGRLAELAGTTELTVALDSVEVAAGLHDALRARGTRAEVLIELDVGMGRTGVADASAARALAEAVERLGGGGAAAGGLSVAGISCYPGHVRGRLDEVRAGLRAVRARLEEARAALEAAGLRCDRISGGSTASLLLSHETGATEVRAGNYVFLDRSEARGAWTAQDAALNVHATVVSTAVPGRAVLDAGSKTLGEAGAPAGLTGWGAVVGAPQVEIVSLNEEHAVCALPEPSWTVGDRVAVVPNHVCTCVNLHDLLYAARDGVVEEVWPVLARGAVR
jgi:D-serine deaminase-like pyridoxal phosphate-dependent protein